MKESSKLFVLFFFLCSLMFMGCSPIQKEKHTFSIGDKTFLLDGIWGIERSGFFNGREKWAKGFENQRV